MNEKRLLKIEEIYHRVLDVPVEERSTFLAEACGEDSELLSEVESLISFAEKDSSLIDTPPMDVAAEMLFHDEHTRFIGREIGQYKILSHIGTGGMGEVFLAEDSKLERFAAIKFIKPEIAQMPDQLQRFLQEAKTASALNHPNIITVYEIGDTNGIQYIATEFIEGKTLRTLMKENSLTLPEILDIISQVATAAQSAHSAGIIHRDIKPENIMLRDDKLVKVLDFGLAKLGNRGDTETRREEDGKKDLKITNNSPSPRSSVSASFSLTQSGLMMGTAAYMSPEQARIGEIDKRTDIWSIGVVFYEMLCGQKPFSGETAKEKINAILEKEPEPFGENLPFELREIIEKTLEKDSDKRFQSAEDFLQAVDDFRSKIIREDKKLNKSSFSGKQHITSPNEVRNTASAAFASDSAKPSDHENISSAEFIFTEVRKHKVFSSGIFAVFIFALVIGIYFYLKINSEPDNSIAVMPFVNASGDPDMEYLSDGISRSLIDSLSKLSGVKVIAGSSTFDYKGKNTPPEEIARELGVKFILNGRIRELGDNLEISAELIDAGDRTLIWSERFNRKKKDIFAVENEISRKIADNLHIHLTNFEQNEFAKKTETDPRAYELLLKGLFYQQKSSPENLEKAVGYFKQAIEIDPNYAEAHAALAHIYLNMGENSFLDPKKAMPKAKAAAQRALELNENLAEVHLTLAGIKRAEWDWSAAERQFKRALKLNPNLADVYFKYAFFLSTQGKHPEAISAIKKARELDPLKHHINTDIAYIYYFARQYELANVQYEIGRELNPDYGGTFYGLGFINVAQGKYRAAVLNYKKTIEIIGEHTGVKCYLGFALAKSGQTAEAEKILKELETGEKYVSPVELAILYIGLEKREKAITALERAYAIHDSQMQYLGVEPHFDSLRSDQRFIDLMKKVGLTPGNFR